jgi:hypothetical protein
MWEVIFYIMLFWEGGGGILSALLFLIAGVALHETFTVVTIILLIAEVVVSVVGIVRRAEEGTGVFKAIAASFLCVLNTAQFFFALGEENFFIFFLAVYMFGLVWAAGVVLPWFSVLEDGKGDGFVLEVVITVGFFVLTQVM